MRWIPSIPDTLGPVQSVLIKGGVLISGVVLYTSLCSWGHAYSVLIKGDVLISGVSFKTGSTVLIEDSLAYHLPSQRHGYIPILNIIIS